MKHKLTKKLVLYFSSVILLFSVIVGSLFFVLFTNDTGRLLAKDMLKRSSVIADTLSEFPQFSHSLDTPFDDEDYGEYKRGHGYGYGGGNNSNWGQGGSGFGAYLKFINDAAMSDVWIVDIDGNVISSGSKNITTSPNLAVPDLDSFIAKVFLGDTSVYKDNFLVPGKSFITSGAPVYNDSGSVTSAVILHAFVDAKSNTIPSGVAILMVCILVALVLASFLSIVLAMHFIRPLYKMNSATTELINGNYHVQTLVSQDDEIGMLAHNIDVLSNRLSEGELESVKLDKLRKDFISNISHELRTPVTVIRGSLEALNDGVVTDPLQVHDYYSQMLNDTIHLQRLVNDLLELSRLQNADFNIEMLEMNVIDALNEAVRSMRSIAISTGVTLDLCIEEGTFFNILGDYVRIRQMFLIVLDNGIKYSSQDTVCVKVNVVDGHLSIAISNCGLCISAEDLEHIFDRFYRSRNEKNKSSGTGLGLPIAKEIAARHAIAIDCTCEPFDSYFLTTFTFVFNACF